MGLFGKKKNIPATTLPTNVYIVEDNALYAQQIEFFLRKQFGEEITLQRFPVSEVIDVKLEHGHKPDVILMDQFLNDKYEDASSGLESLREIHSKYPNILLVLHTSDQNMAEASRDICEYVPKGDGALERIEELVRKKIEQKTT